MGSEIPEKQPEAGVVLHQPLNRAIFRFFGKKDQKMNGISVSPGQKTQNAPTWQVEKQARRRPFSAYFEQQSHPRFDLLQHRMVSLSEVKRNNIHI